MIPPPPDPVRAVYDCRAAPQRAALLDLRALIHDVAATTPGVGPLEEVLRWGEPAFITPRTKSASTIRINALKGTDDHYAVYFICHTGLVDHFREIYPDVFAFEDRRALVFAVGTPLPELELRHCLGMALTYHLNK